MARAKATHTPGPWTVKKCVQQGFPLIVCGKEFYPAAILGDGRLNRGTARANARLIAAAPELLESLRSLVNTLEAAWSEKQLTAPRFVQCQLGEEVKRATSRIAKAEGRQARERVAGGDGCDEYADVDAVDRVLVEPAGGGGWLVNAVDAIGRRTARFWDAERDCETPLTRLRAIQLAPEFAASLGKPGLRIEVAADESCNPEQENDTRSPERGNDA